MQISLQKQKGRTTTVFFETSLISNFNEQKILNLIEKLVAKYSILKDKFMSFLREWKLTEMNNQLRAEKHLRKSKVPLIG